MDKSSKKKVKCKKITQFEIIRPQVAGIDVSDNAGMMVAYPINEKEIVVEEYECYTGDLHRLGSSILDSNITYTENFFNDDPNSYNGHGYGTSWVRQ